MIALRLVLATRTGAMPAAIRCSTMLRITIYATLIAILTMEAASAQYDPWRTQKQKENDQDIDHAVCTAFAQPVALSLKTSTERRIIGLTEGFDELRRTDTGCAEGILARQNDVAEQSIALFRQVSFPGGSRKMDRTTSLAATSGAYFPFLR
jgi:hypothetical protein